MKTITINFGGFKDDNQVEYPNTYPVWNGSNWSRPMGEETYTEAQVAKALARALDEQEQTSRRVKVLRDVMRRVCGPPPHVAHCKTMYLEPEACDCALAGGSDDQEHP